MAYCYECGSEVAKNDVFCPNCGITLEASSAVEVESGDLNSDENGMEVSPQPDVNINSKTGDLSLSDTEENWRINTGSVDLQDADFANTSPEKQFDIYKPAVDKIAENTETGKTSAGTDSDEINLRNDSQPNAEPANDFDLTVPYLPPMLENQESSAVKMAEEIKSYQSAISVEKDVEKIEDSNINVPPSEIGISKPLEKLEMPETPPNSVFDSVRIMETAPPKDKSANNENKFAPVEIAPVQADENELLPKKSSDNIRSYTTPNIGGSSGGDTDGKKRAKLKPLDEGTILNGRYEIIRKIGGGGMGAVYLASDNNLGGVLRAVKEMVQSYIEDEQQEKAINDFKRESMILSTLDHSSIPTIYDYFYDEKESRFYLAMKYISGGDLSARLRSAPEGRIDERSVTEWAIQIADVLDYLHNRPTTIVYRDLKPSNIMIDGNTGRVMLIDFGIARSVNKEEKGVTAVGTMGYAPPELFSGNVEPRSDIYSLGSTLFHLLTGADPQSNPLLIFDFQKNPRPRQINSALSDQIEKILMRSVEYNVQARYSSAGELRRALEEHLENLKNNRVTYGIKENPASVGLENQPVFCGFCGQRIMATDMFCAFCGSRQPLSQKGVHSEIYSPSAVTAKLMIYGTSELESPVFNLDKDENLLGRRDPMSNIFPEVDLSKFDPQTKISRRHARIWREGSVYMVEDLGSSNGTVVIPVVSGTVRLPPRTPHVLANGDKIRLGDTTLHFALK
ncbi:MAG: protein kinase [Acidobacteriota bacterium]|nr:protein kinase [Acidobacteriota bacterium]